MTSTFLSRDDEHRLAVRSRDASLTPAERLAARNALIEANLPSIRAVAKRYRGLQRPWDDMIGDGQVGLVMAADRYDPACGVRFFTYAKTHIRGQILRGFREELPGSWVNENDYWAGRRWLNARDRLTDGNGTRPTDAAVATALEISPHSAALASRAADVLAGRRVNPAPVFRAIADRSAAPTAAIEQADDIRAVRKAVADLPDPLRTVISDRYLGQDCVTYRALSRADGRSHSRIEQFTQKGLRKLRHALTREDDQ